MKTTRRKGTAISQFLSELQEFAVKKVGDLMREMGFREDAPQSVKEAFIKNLIKATTGVEVKTPSEKILEKQLSFDFGPAPTAPPKKVG